MSLHEQDLLFFVFKNIKKMILSQGTEILHSL